MSQRLIHHAKACLIAGLIGDAMGTPTENLGYTEIVSRFGWVDDISGTGTDDTIMKHLLAHALIDTHGQATLDDWAAQWLADWDAIFGPKVSKFFVSVLHTAQKLRRHAVPRMAALGNMPSSSSAMCIAPVGIVNACDPVAAARQAYDLASLIHVHDVGFCQDAAAALAAGVAEALATDATVDSVLEAALGAILPLSGAEMRQRITRLLDMAEACAAYEPFRERLYAEAKTHFCRITCDSRETLPFTLAIFRLADGEPALALPYAANLGRDADTIATMVGALSGALRGIDALPTQWTDKLSTTTLSQQQDMAQQLVGAAIAKRDRQLSAFSRLSHSL